MDSEGELITDPTKICETFNKNFVFMGPNIDKRIPSAKPHYNEYMKNIKVSNSFFLKPANSTEIKEIILSLDINKSLGPNSVPVFILKVCDNLFAHYLSAIINISFVTGIFPDLCKVAKVIPVFKKDDPLNCLNYHPISLLPVFSKIFEKVIYKRMYEYLEKNKLIYNCQFGFKANHSTNHALISMTEKLKTLLDSKHIVAGVYIDLEKAFDTINHEILCDKLNYCGLRGKINQLIKSFLSNREQFVYINGYESPKEKVTCGVPQGSTLGPLLFLLYINDLRFTLKHSEASHFADDTAIICQSRNKNKLEINLNNDLSCLSEWLNANRLSLNVDKTKLLIFRSKKSNINPSDIKIKLANTRLKVSSHVKYFGDFLDEHLSWTCHNNLSTSLSRINSILSKLRHFAPFTSLIAVYYALFYSKLLYGSPTLYLASSPNLNTIKILQKKCIRIINFSPFNTHTNPLFAENKLLKFDDIITYGRHKTVFDFYKGYLPEDLQDLFKFSENIHTDNTRNSSNDGLFLPKVESTNFGIYSIRYKAPTVWNQYIKDFPNMRKLKSSNQFKTSLRKHFLSTYVNLV